MNRNQLQDILYTISAMDPDGMPDEPTDADYDAHEKWAVDKYGYEIWDMYVNTNWRKGGIS